MSFLQFIRLLRARMWIILISTAACFLAGLITAFSLPEQFDAESRVMMELIKPDPVTGEVMSTSFSRAYVPTQTELIRDYPVAGRVVDKLGWTKSPEMFEAYQADEGKGSIDFRRWLAQQVSSGTSAYNVQGSNILAIGYSAGDPETAAKMADAVRDAYVEESMVGKRASATSSAAWFDEQVAKVRAELTAAEARKVSFERTNRIVLQADNTDTDSSRLQALASQAPMSAPIGGGSTAAAAALSQLDARIANESLTLGPNHPLIQDLKRQRVAAASAAAQERAAGRISPGPSIASEVAGQRNLVLAQRDKVEEARRLQSDVVVLRDLYTKTAARAADLRQQAASNESGLTLLGSAIPPVNPSVPNIPLILFGSLGLGLGLGVLVALITELLNRRVRGVEDLEKAGVPVMVVMSAPASLGSR